MIAAFLVLLAAAHFAKSTEYQILIWPAASSPALAAAPAPPPPPPPPPQAKSSASCFPALNFVMPSSVPDHLDGWWCPPSTEYAFMGFSYEVTECQSRKKLNREFADIRHTFSGRYVRLYGACDRNGFYDDVIDAAWNNGLGVHALIWFGFDGDDQWIGRRKNLFDTLHNNPKAPFVTRGVQFGSEPLFDSVLSHQELAKQVLAAKNDLAPLRIQVTVSEMAYGYQKNGGAQDVLDAVDFLDIHMLPFFSQSASTAAHSWPIVYGDLQWFIKRAKGKKLYLDENGWPSKSYPGVEPNSPNAVADVPNERDYYTLLDQHCPDLKVMPGGGIGWFAHIYSDSQEPGYGIYDYNGRPKFPFHPRTTC
ncbi:hypothetical protein EIP91_009249 [Steccherinum ochraceum]|uniref:glucan endo-1,3-beta-D-glucosidase n=1 Tax=Steccherinum ochraceum TaxID=92696 RepID=A0A4R0RBM6_9APHY|nr:hypothetical protein EIP91_009249 [Steccherinum ochraceum]